jgi:hypothetical protein
MKWMVQIAIDLKRCFPRHFSERAEVLVGSAEANRYEMDRADSDGIKKVFPGSILQKGGNSGAVC